MKSTLGAILAVILSTMMMANACAEQPWGDDLLPGDNDDTREEDARIARECSWAMFRSVSHPRPHTIGRRLKNPDVTI